MNKLKMDPIEGPSKSAKIDNPLGSGNQRERKRVLCYTTTDESHNETPKKKIKNSNDKEMKKEKEPFVITVSNIPYDWTYDQITEYLEEHGIFANAMELGIGSPETGQTLKIMFLDFDNCNRARKQLKLKTMEGRNLQVVFSVPEDSDSDMESNYTLLDRRSTGSTPFKPDLDVWAPDPNGTYGLKPDYLESLAITPPLDKWIHVSNFRCDKSELRDVLELAGHVVLCIVVCVKNKYARVMYEHPLEAVQAVSMLNGQVFYGTELKVSMYKCQDNEIILPKGLPKVGPGLGLNGRPLRDLVQQYERYLSGKYSCINTSVFTDTSIAISNTPANIDNITENDNERNERDSEMCNTTFDRSKQNGSTSSQLLPQHKPNVTGVPKPSVVQPNLSRTSSSATAHSFQNNPVQLQHDPRKPGYMEKGNSGPGYGLHDQHSMHTHTVRGSLPYSAVTAHNGDHSMMDGYASRMPHLHHGNLMLGCNTYNKPLEYNPIQVRNPAPVPNPVWSAAISQSLPLGANDWENPNFKRAEMELSSISNGNRNSCGPGDHPCMGTNFSMVELSNLPLSTTFPLLSEKMAEIGRVLSLEFTQPGCALVRFANPEHAQTCYQYYNKRCVMGNIIEVKFV